MGTEAERAVIASGTSQINKGDAAQFFGIEQLFSTQFVMGNLCKKRRSLIYDFNEIGL